MPIDSPVSIEVRTAILVATHCDVVWIHVLSLINDLTFIDELLFNILRPIWIDYRNEKELALAEHLLVIFVVLDDTLVNHFQKHEKWSL